MDSAGKQVQTPLFEGILRRNPVDQDRARERLQAARTEVQILLWDIEAAGQQDRTAENETGDRADRAQPLNAEGVDDAVAIDWRRSTVPSRGWTAGRSRGPFRSGLPIPAERLEADPAAELTVEQARAL